MKPLLIVLTALLIIALNAAALHDILAQEPNLTLEWTTLGLTVAGLAGTVLRRLVARAT